MQFIKLVRGQDVRKPIEYTDDDGNAIDATGSSVSAYLRHPFSHDAYEVTVTASWDSEVEGLGTLAISAAETVKIPLGALSELVVTVVDVNNLTTVFVGGMLEAE